MYDVNGLLIRLKGVPEPTVIALSTSSVFIVPVNETSVVAVVFKE